MRSYRSPTMPCTIVAIIQALADVNSGHVPDNSPGMHLQSMSTNC